MMTAEEIQRRMSSDTRAPDAPRDEARVRVNIQKNAPMPDRTAPALSPISQGLEALRPVRRTADGRFIGDVLKVQGKTQTQLGYYVARAAKRLGRKFAIRKLDDDIVGVWRVDSATDEAAPAARDTQEWTLSS